MVGLRERAYCHSTCGVGATPTMTHKRSMSRISLSITTLPRHFSEITTVYFTQQNPIRSMGTPHILLIKRSKNI